MRSITQLAKVEGHSSLVRDMSSHAIISTNDNEFAAYQKRREAEKKRASKIEHHFEEIECLKKEMSEIKQMLVQLLRTKGM